MHKPTLERYKRKKYWFPVDDMGVRWEIGVDCIPWSLFFILNHINVVPIQ